jgi:hypothetical protein
MKRTCELSIGICVAGLLSLLVARSSNGVASEVPSVRQQSLSSSFGQEPSRLDTRGSQVAIAVGTSSNVCRCLPPIPSEASATGACTRTQDDGTFCQLTFSIPQKAAALSQSPNFDEYSKAWGFSISRDHIEPLAGRLQSGDMLNLQNADIADSIRAAATVAAFERPNDSSTQSHFRDIFEMLTIQGHFDRYLNAPIIHSITHFAANAQEGPPQVEHVTGTNGRAYELATTPGCISFYEGRFSFLVRATGAASSCELAR